MIEGRKIVVWISCGAASAVAAKLTLEKYGANNTVCLVNNPVKEEHPDNLRFMRDLAEWYGQDIETALNPKYLSGSAVEVWDDRKFMSGVSKGYSGAPCTTELKKEARYIWEAREKPDFHVLGFTSEEKKRHDRFVLTERDNVLPVLIDHGFTKEDCLYFLSVEGIAPPIVYSMGLPNANCLGCVKATSPTYWNLIRKLFPDVFEERAKQSRAIGARLVRVKNVRIFLDELDPEAVGNKLTSYDVECGTFCEER